MNLYRSKVALATVASVACAVSLQFVLAAEIATHEDFQGRATAQSFPLFQKNSLYVNLRTKIIAAGWRPASTADADKCETGDSRCAGRPEMQSCAGTGEANCLFLWRKHETLFAISTVGDPAIVSAIKCRSHCR